MIADCFPFFNELDVLEMRLRHMDTLTPRPDRFVIVEMTRTFSGQPKPLYFQPNADRYKPWHDRIRHIICADDGVIVRDVGGKIRTLPEYCIPLGSEYQDGWAREVHQRNAIVFGIEDYGDDDVAIVSDVDELPGRIPSKVPYPLVLAYYQHFYYYTLNHRCSQPWIGTKACAVQTLRALSPDVVRRVGRLEPYKYLGAILNDGDGMFGGWHFSHLYGSDVEKYQAKLRAGSHQEFNTDEYTDPKKIIDRVANGRDLFDRADMQFALTPIDASYPAVIRDDPSRWWPYILEGYGANT